MKKLLGIFVLGIVLLGASAFAQEVVLDNKAEQFVKDVAEIKGVDQDNVQGIKELNINDLPEAVNLENIDSTNLAVYEITVENEENPVYVITASSKFFKDTVRVFAQKMLLNFGLSGEISSDVFMKASGEVVTDVNRGYVMARDGSITAISTNLEIVSGSGFEPVEVVIYKNSQEVGFRNSFNIKNPSVYSDYDVISSDTLRFNKGDVISVEIKMPEGVVARDVITLLEIEVE